jgi:hypothetical protein
MTVLDSGTRRRLHPLAAAAVVIVIATTILPRQVWAHGGGPGLDYDPCAQSAGMNNYVHFSAYQPEFNRFAEYCGGVPQGGRTLLVFDLVGSELTNAPVAVEIAQNGGTRRVAIPARRYPSGVIDVQTDLASGAYSAMLTIGTIPVVYRVHFDLEVGAWWHPLVAPLTVAAIILIVAAVYCLFQARTLAAETLRAAPLTLATSKPE